MRHILSVLVAILFLGSAFAQESQVPLKPGAGRDLVELNCSACHSLDYPRINSPFLSRQGWDAEVNKMIKAFGAPIQPADAKIIIDYLVEHYGANK